MAMTPIQPYEIPKAGTWPVPRAKWALRDDQAALLVHDMQEYFLRPFSASQAPLNSVSTNVHALVEFARAIGLPVFFSAQPGEQEKSERGLLWDLWGPGIIASPGEERLGVGLRVEETDVLVKKRRYSAFFETDFEDALRSRQRSQLIICGVYAHIGCLATAVDGFSRGVAPFIVSDAVADFTALDHEFALRQVARTCGIVHTTEDVIMKLALGRVKRLLNDLVPEVEALGDEEDFYDAGLDSIRAIRLVESLFPVGGYDFERLVDARTPKALAELLIATNAKRFAEDLL